MEFALGLYFGGMAILLILKFTVLENLGYFMTQGNFLPGGCFTCNQPTWKTFLKTAGSNIFLTIFYPILLPIYFVITRFIFT